MKKDIFIKSILLAVLLFAGTSCSEDILNYSDPNNLGTDNYFKTPGQISEAATSIYVAFRSNNMIGWEWQEMFDALANEFDGAPGSEPDIINIKKYQ